LTSVVVCDTNDFMGRRAATMWSKVRDFLFVLLLGASSAYASPGTTDFVVRYGWNNTVRSERWFPVTVLPGDQVQQVEVTVTPRYTNRTRRPPTQYRSAGNTNTVFARLWQQDSHVVCSWTDVDGNRHQMPLFFKPVSDKVLVGLLSDDPARLDFIVSTRKKPVPVRLSPNFIRGDTRYLDFLDCLIVDRTADSFTPEQEKTILSWLLQGGRCVFTPRSLQPGERRWSFLSELSVGEKVQIATPMLARLLPDFAPYLKTIPVLHCEAPARNTVLREKQSVLIAAKPLDQGRVVVVSIPWEEIPVPDLRALDGLRRELWEQIMTVAGIEDQRHRDSPYPQVHIPDSAKGSFLKWYLLSFLGIYFLCFGVVNCLALRMRRCFELSVVTLPVGALLLSLLAFGIGVGLRGRDTYINNIAVITQSAGRLISRSTSSLLMGDGRPIRLHAAQSDSHIDAGSQSGRYSSESNNRTELTHHDGPQNAIEGHGLRMWSVSPWHVQRISKEGTLTATAELGEDAIKGTVTSELPFALTHAAIVHGWDMVTLGSLEPHETREFTLPLTSIADSEQRPCPNCGRYHGSEPPMALDEKPDSDMDGELHRIYQSLGWGLRRKLRSQVVIVGTIEVHAPPIEIDRPDVRTDAAALLVHPIDVTTGPSISLPFGKVPTVASKPEWTTDCLLPYDDLTYLPWARRLGALGEKTDPSTTFEDMVISGDANMPLPVSAHEWRYAGHRLPVVAGTWKVEDLTVRWTSRSPHTGPDTPPQEVELLLEAFDWNEETWTRLDKAKPGHTNVLSVSSPETFVHSQSGLMSFRHAIHSMKQTTPPGRQVRVTRQVDVSVKASVNRTEGVP